MQRVARQRGKGRRMKLGFRRFRRKSLGILGIGFGGYVLGVKT